MLFVLVGCGIVGFVDDTARWCVKDTRADRPLEVFLAIGDCADCRIRHVRRRKRHASHRAGCPFFKDVMPQLGLLYILLAYFVIVGTSNAVNLTDGLDGLAIMPTVFVAAGFALVAWATGNMNFANYLHIPYLRHAGELVIVCTAIVGAGLGFLWFQYLPGSGVYGRRRFAGAGRRAGHHRGAAAPGVLAGDHGRRVRGRDAVGDPAGGIVQAARTTHFPHGPIHHHYELKGWPEPRVIVRFWIISLMLVLIGLATLKVR